jgi:hypothetical protein
MSVKGRQYRWTFLLRVDRAIATEAKHVLYQSQHFIVDSMKSAIPFLLNARADDRRHITHLTITESGPMLADEFTTCSVTPLGCATRPSLCLRGRARHLTITLPSRTRMSLGQHIDDHYDSLQAYLDPVCVDPTEALRRQHHLRLGRCSAAF